MFEKHLAIGEAYQKQGGRNSGNQSGASRSSTGDDSKRSGKDEPLTAVTETSKVR